MLLPLFFVPSRLRNKKWVSSESRGLGLAGGIVVDQDRVRKPLNRVLQGHHALKNHQIQLRDGRNLLTEVHVPSALSVLLKEKIRVMTNRFHVLPDRHPKTFVTAKKGIVKNVLFKSVVIQKNAVKDHIKKEQKAVMMESVHIKREWTLLTVKNGHTNKEMKMRHVPKDLSNVSHVTEMNVRLKEEGTHLQADLIKRAQVRDLI